MIQGGGGGILFLSMIQGGESDSKCESWPWPDIYVLYEDIKFETEEETERFISETNAKNIEIKMEIPSAPEEEPEDLETDEEPKDQEDDEESDDIEEEQDLDRVTDEV